ncbi:MAG TPA: polysaccharide deacetylase family protein [Vicinamibacteria bacterium]|nr:polysaccharide deacetylase family protein [Vicinamibacteria bacterium]
MHLGRRPSLLQCALVVAAWGGLAAGKASAAGRTMAVTFDDLPGPPAGLLSNSVSGLTENTRKLVATFAKHRIPVVGFVNEGKLVVPGETPEDLAARTSILKMWVDAGLELGNHTYSHQSLNGTPLDAFEADLLRGEPVTRRLLAENGRKLRYFRHPFLHVGLDLDKRHAFEAFLAERGYSVAPVTIDNDDYVYAAIYAAALRGGDRARADAIGADYLRYMDTVFSFYEGLSRRLTGREIPQILLVHANTLNADCFDGLAAAIEARGYAFRSLEDALEDEAYRLPDTYVGNWGISWLLHWEQTREGKRSPSPDPPDWVTRAFEALPH